VGNADPGRFLVSRRHCLALDLVKDAALIQEYCRMHEPGSVWPAVIGHIRAQGIESMEIWQRGDRLLMIIEASDDYPRSDPSEFHRLEAARWEACMSTFQRVLPDHAPGKKWSPMRCIFRLADHVGESDT
jgi:L-rhamnose mutarotase